MINFKCLNNEIEFKSLTESYTCFKEESNENKYCLAKLINKFNKENIARKYYKIDDSRVIFLSKFPGILYQPKVTKNWTNIFTLEALNINSSRFGDLCDYTKDKVLPVVTRFIMMWLEINNFGSKLI